MTADDEQGVGGKDSQGNAGDKKRPRKARTGPRRRAKESGAQERVSAPSARGEEPEGIVQPDPARARRATATRRMENRGAGKSAIRDAKRAAVEALATERRKDSKALVEPSVAAEGVAAEGIAAEGIADEGIAAEGIADEGIAAEGIAAEGIADEGIADEGIADESELTPPTRVVSSNPKSSPRSVTVKKVASKAPRVRREHHANVDGECILVTGASGFLGKHLLDKLLHDYPLTRLRALVRRPSLHLQKAANAAGPVEVVLGDVCDAQACDIAVKGVVQIYHLAGRVARTSDEAGAMYRLHVEGTRTLLQAAGRVDHKPRILVVSSSGTIAVSTHGQVVADEESGYKKDIVRHWPYYLSKIYQEETALRLAEELELELVLVLPSLLLGPGDDRGSSTLDAEKVVRGHLPLIPKGGGVAFVDARDAAAGCILAMQRGRSSARYLLSGANMTIESYLGRIARLAGVASPRAWAPTALMKGVGSVLDGLWRDRDEGPPFSKQSIEMAEHTWYVDAKKARDELGWQPRDAQQTLVDTVKDIKERRRLAPMPVT